MLFTMNKRNLDLHFRRLNSERIVIATLLAGQRENWNALILYIYERLMYNALRKRRVQFPAKMKKK